MVCSPAQPMWDVTIHPHSGLSILVGTLSFLESTWDCTQILLLWGPTSLLAHCLVSILIWRTARRLAHRLVSGSDIICNAPDPPLVDIVLFEIFRASPQDFKTRSTLDGTLSFLQSMWDRPQILFLWVQHPYWHTASCLSPFEEQREGWHIVWCLTLIPFVTAQIHG